MEQRVDLELLLAVDVSDSITDEEALLQRRGYVSALTDSAVLAAIESGPHGAIALSYVEWAGFGHYKVVTDWTLIDSRSAAETFVALLAAVPIETRLRTSISDTIIRSIAHFTDNGFRGTRRIIDISGDGPNNWGPNVAEARDRAVAAGITINGLPILPHPSQIETHGAIAELDHYYEDCVIGGPGAFLIVAEDFGTFAEAIRRKLVLEIAGDVPGGPEPVQLASRQSAWATRNAAPREPIPCTIGEWLWWSRPFAPD